jgi:hypothetical protein
MDIVGTTIALPMSQLIFVTIIFSMEKEMKIISWEQVFLYTIE